MSIRKQEASIGRGIESNNARDDTLSGFFYFGLANKLRGSGASDIGYSRSWLGGTTISFLFSQHWC